MTGPPAAPGAGGHHQRPKPKSGRPEGKTTGRRELARNPRFAEISPEVGVLDERAVSRALADDPAAFELLAAMTTATDETLRAAAIRLSASIVLERARAGRPSMRGISRLRPGRGATDGDLDLDASIDGRSEEHTSELQSPYDIVCRLLLEKKKTQKISLFYKKKEKRTIQTLEKLLQI